MLFSRLYEANKKASKRFALFLGGKQQQNEMEMVWGMKRKDCVGTYRKRKGCECRRCSAMKLREKNTLKKQLRRESRELADKTLKKNCSLHIILKD